MGAKILTGFSLRYCKNCLSSNFDWHNKKINWLSIFNLDELTRDYTYSIKDKQLRKAKLIPWIEDDEDLDDLCEGDPTIQHEPDANYFNVI